MEPNRKIIHIDMDAFYASVEQLDHPELRGKPVIVGGRPDSRGVVAACSYEARRYGIHSAMACSHAYRRCPQAVFIKPRLSRYREFSARIMEIFRKYTDAIEPLSLDEAFLDVTRNKIGQSSATVLAQQICREITAATGLTASAGVSCNKFVAKIASDLNKPNGISVIKPEQVAQFLAGLAIGKFFGVGRVTEKKMLALGIRTGSDLRNRSREELCHYFGKAGGFYYDIVRGHDPRPVQTRRERKSIGTERTLKEDINDVDAMVDILHELSQRLAERLHAKGLGCRTVTLKVRYSDFSTVTRSLTAGELLQHQQAFFSLVPRLLDATEAGCREVRLLGLSLSNLGPIDRPVPRQLPLPFPPPGSDR